MSDARECRRVLVKPSADEANGAVSDLFRDIVREAVKRRGICHIALAGGTTPHGLYQRLADEAASGQVPWEHVEVFFGDERDVPHDHVESNYKMAQRTLLDHAPVQPGRVHPMPADATDLEAASGEYEQVIRRVVGDESDDVPRFDLILLGMGGDGHTASLFPNTDAVAEDSRLVMAHFVPVLGRKRMTFTLPLINAARNIVMLITGDDKAEAVANMFGDDAEARGDIPAAHVCPDDGQLIIVLDAAAARMADQLPQ